MVKDSIVFHHTIICTHYSSFNILGHAYQGLFDINSYYPAMSIDHKLLEFKEKLDSQHRWPSLYMFKFIVPKGQENSIIDLFPKNEVKTKASKRGNYISVTSQVMMGSSDDVIKIYQDAHKVEGVIAL